MKLKDVHAAGILFLSVTEIKYLKKMVKEIINEKPSESLFQIEHAQVNAQFENDYQMDFH